MKAEYINPFFKATGDVFRVMLDIDVEKGALNIVDDLVPGKDASVIIGVSGDLSGSILFSFPHKMIFEMVKIMSGMELEKLDSFVGSALGELANIICGNAITYLAANNFRCNIVPPQVLIGEMSSLSMATDQALVVSLLTDIGEFDITIALKNSD